MPRIVLRILRRTVLQFLIVPLAIGFWVWFGLNPQTQPSALAASLSCPFSDSDGGTPGIQVTGSVIVDDVDDAGGAVGDFYDCTASLVEISPHAPRGPAAHQ